MRVICYSTPDGNRLELDAGSPITWGRLRVRGWLSVPLPPSGKLTMDGMPPGAVLCIDVAWKPVGHPIAEETGIIVNVPPPAEPVLRLAEMPGVPYDTPVEGKLGEELSISV